MRGREAAVSPTKKKPVVKAIEYDVNPKDRNSRLGKFLLRIKGRKVTATNYHLYFDCARVAPYLRDGDEWETIEATDTIIDLLRLRPCRLCQRGFEHKSLEDVLFAFFEEDVLSVLEEDVLAEEVEEAEAWIRSQIETLLRVLSDNGFVIVEKGEKS
jgi:hypothetical protein